MVVDLLHLARLSPAFIVCISRGGEVTGVLRAPCHGYVSFEKTLVPLLLKEPIVGSCLTSDRDLHLVIHWLVILRIADKVMDALQVL